MTTEGKIEKGRAGQSFEDLLREQGTLEETNEVAIKRDPGGRSLTFESSASVQARAAE